MISLFLLVLWGTCEEKRKEPMGINNFKRTKSVSLSRLRWSERSGRRVERKRERREGIQLHWEVNWNGGTEILWGHNTVTFMCRRLRRWCQSLLETFMVWRMHTESYRAWYPEKCHFDLLLLRIPFFHRLFFPFLIYFFVTLFKNICNEFYSFLNFKTFK